MILRLMLFSSKNTCCALLALDTGHLQVPVMHKDLRGGICVKPYMLVVTLSNYIALK